jgi:hypothetical protein
MRAMKRRETRKGSAPKKKPFTVCLDPSMIDRLECIAEVFAGTLPGSRSMVPDAARAAISLGVAALERRTKRQGKTRREEHK